MILKRKYHLALQSALMSIFFVISNFPLLKDHVAVSVIIPVYNVEKYISQCLNTILNQSIKNIEIICINDSSSDNTLEILQNFAKNDKRIRIFSNYRNVGPGVCRNLGIQMAKGEYIAVIDADDWINPGFLKKLYKKAKLNNADLSMCLVVNFNAQTEQFYTRDEFTLLGRLTPKFTNKVFTWKDIAQNVFVIPFHSFNKLYRKDFLLKNDIKFSNTFFLEDHSFSFKSILLAKKITYLPEQLYVYRTHQNQNLSGTKDEKLLKCFPEYAKLEKILIQANARELIPQTLVYILNSVRMRFDSVLKDVKPKFIEMAKIYFKNSDLLTMIDYKLVPNFHKKFLHDLFFHMSEDKTMKDRIHFMIHHPKGYDLHLDKT